MKDNWKNVIDLTVEFERLYMEISLLLELKSSCSLCKKKWYEQCTFKYKGVGLLTCLGYCKQYCKGQPTKMSMNKWMVKKMWCISTQVKICVCVYTHTHIYRHIHTMEYYSAIKKNESMSFAPTRINLEITKLSEANQTEKQIYDLTYIWDLKKW